MRSKPPQRPAKPARQSVAELRALQRLMAAAVMRPLDRAGQMRSRWSDGQTTKNVVAGFIKPNDRLTAFERLEIYNRQYWFRLIDCFYDDYPGLRAGLGDDRFYDLTLAYLLAHPSTHFTLRDLGWRLIDFIKKQSRWTKPHQSLALEISKLEWAHIEAFDNEARTPIALAELSGKDAGRIYLKLQPYITLLKLTYPFDDYLINLRENSRLRGEASNAIENEDAPKKSRRASAKKNALEFSRIKSGTPIRLAVHRHNNMVYYKRLDPVQYRLLENIQKGKSLSQALTALPKNADLSQLQQWFSDWAALGWFYSAANSRNRRLRSK